MAYQQQKIIANVPKEELEEVRRFAEGEKRTISSLTRKALVDYMKKVKKMEDLENAKINI